MTINVTKDNNIIKSSDIDENVKYNNKNIATNINRNICQVPPTNIFHIK